MPIDIRPLPVDYEFRRYVDVIASGFHEETNELDVADWERMSERDRILAAWDGDRIVGGAAAVSFRLTIPGAEVGAAGVTAVSVLPSHRRRGILRELMRRQLDDVRARGEPVAILWASEGGIYQRFGYGLASLGANIEVDRTRTAYRRPFQPEGQVRLVDQAEASRLFPPVYDQVRRERTGFYDLSPARFEIEVLADPERHRRGAGRKFYALYEADGRPEGYAIYRPKHDWDHRGPKSVLEVRDLMAATPRAARDLWRFVFDIDLMQTITAGRQPVDHPLLLLVQEPRRLGFTVGDALWLRIVDLAATLSARTYRGKDTITFEVTDEFCPWNAGSWRLEVGSGRGRVKSAAGNPDLLVDVTDLAAAYLGAFSFAELVRAGRVTECSPGAVERVDAVFATDRAPWCPQVF